MGDSGQTVDGPANDVRGYEVRDQTGNGIGKVADLLVDDAAEKVRFLVVERGGLFGFGETKTLIPVDTVTKITEDEVFVDQTRERVASAPGYAPHLVEDRPYQSSVYSHDGYMPYWGPGYLYPVGLAFLPMSDPGR